VIPQLGPDCDTCAPDCHYLIECPECGADFDAPPVPGDQECTQCGCYAGTVSDEDHAAWLALLLGPAN
jgi:hypothetical protein